MMKFLLLILTLMTVSEAGGDSDDDDDDDDGDDDDDDMNACIQGWIQFTCKYREQNEIYEYIDVLTPNGTTLRSSQKDVWEDKDRFSLYHNTTHGKLEVAVKHLEQEDFGEYQCKFNGSNSSHRIKKWKWEPGSCQQPSTRSAQRAAKTTITCDYPDDDEVRFLCKGESFTCEDVLSTKSPQKSNRKNFIVSISDVSSRDAGVYWCGLESKDGSYRVSVGQIKLEVKAGSQLPTVIAVTVCVGLLLLLVVVFVYKRFGRSKYRTNEEAHNQEGFVYEEIQINAQKSDTRAAVKTVYATANFPTNPSAFTHESKVCNKNSSSEVSCNAYFTLWDSDQCPKANHPSRESQDSHRATAALGRTDCFTDPNQTQLHKLQD